jgi:hypothetical protein
MCTVWERAMVSQGQQKWTAIKQFIEKNVLDGYS